MEVHRAVALVEEELPVGEGALAARLGELGDLLVGDAREHRNVAKAVGGHGPRLRLSPIPSSAYGMLSTELKATAAPIWFEL